MYHELNVISSEKLHRNNILPGTSPLSASVYYIHKLKKNNLSLIFFTLSFFHSFISLFFSIKAGKFITHTVEREEVKKRIVEFVLISQGNILQITTCWETKWKEKFPAAPYSICYMFSSMGIFFSLQILMNI